MHAIKGEKLAFICESMGMVATLALMCILKSELDELESTRNQNKSSLNF